MVTNPSSINFGEFIQQQKSLIDTFQPLITSNRKYAIELKQCKEKILQYETTQKDRVWLKFRKTQQDEFNKDKKENDKKLKEITDLKSKMYSLEDENNKLMSKLKAQ